MTSLARRAFDGATATLFWQVARILLLLVSIIVLARLLSPADFGLLAMVTSIIGIAELIRDFGLSVASIQSKELTDEERSNLFWLNTVIGAMLTFAVYFLSWPIAALYDDVRLIEITQALSVIFVINGIATQFKAQINRALRFVALGAVEVLPQAIAIGLAIAVAMACHSYWALILQVLTASVLEAVLCIALAGWFPGRYRRNVPVRRFLRFAGALVGTQSLAYISKNIDNVLLGVFRGPAELGLYSRAYQIVILPLTQITTPLSRVAIPVLSRLQDSTTKFMEYLKVAQFATIAATSLVYGFLIGFGEPLVRLILGSGWDGASAILQILAISGIFRALGQVPYWIFVSLGQTNKQLLIYLYGQPIIIAAIAVGTTWGTVGVATGCTIGYAAFWALNMWWAGRSTGISTNQLAASGFSLVTVLALPIAVIGLGTVHFFGPGATSLLLGGIPALVWASAMLCGIPRYRSQLLRFSRLARNRGT